MANEHAHDHDGEKSSRRGKRHHATSNQRHDHIALKLLDNDKHEKGPAYGVPAFSQTGPTQG